MKQPIKILIISMLICFLIISCERENMVESESCHPRILLLQGEESQIKELIETNNTWRKMHFAILNECGKIQAKPPVERVLIGRRLLDKSQECLKRVFYLSYAYRMTGQKPYLNRAIQEMVAVADFPDWNPSHFLDVAEMTMGMAIGYDWLYNDIPEESREMIREAIVNKGINPSYDNKYNWFVNSDNNWNQVCNTGMVYGALAVKEDYPDLAMKTVNRALESVKLPMKVYEPDGVYPEGYDYWGYGTSFNVMFLSLWEKTLGIDQEKYLGNSRSFLRTGEFMLHSVAPSGKSFNWGDCGKNAGRLNPAMFWFGERTNDPSVLWMENKFLHVDNFSRFTGQRLLPAIMVWAKNVDLDNIQPPVSNFWFGQGKNPVAMMRTSWTDPNAIYLGFKVGSPSVNHGHMDVGSFVMEADGIRWAADLGKQNYESLESKGMSIFGKDQNAQRWTVFRMNTFSHSVISVNGEQQRVNGYGKIDRYSDDRDFMYAVSDISTIYAGQLKKAVRGVAIKNGAWVVVRDELSTSTTAAKVRWALLTPAVVQLKEEGAILTSGNKKLFLKVSGPENLQMKTWSTAPTNDYDAENPGTILVGFEFDIPAGSSQNIEVLLIPEKAENTAEFINLNFDKW